LDTNGITQWNFKPSCLKSYFLTFIGIYFRPIFYPTFPQRVQILLHLSVSLYRHNLKRITYERFLDFISFGIFYISLFIKFSSAFQVLINFETKTVTLVLSLLRSKVRNAGIEI